VKSPGHTVRATKRRANVSLDELLADTAEASDKSMNSNAINPSELNSKDAGCQSCTSLQAECDRLRKKLEEQLKNHTQSGTDYRIAFGFGEILPERIRHQLTPAR